MCLPILCLALDVLLLLVFASAMMCLPSRCLAMGLHVTIYIERMVQPGRISNIQQAGQMASKALGDTDAAFAT
jgi:hypothetical protein